MTSLITESRCWLAQVRFSFGPQITRITIRIYPLHLWLINFHERALNAEGAAGFDIHRRSGFDIDRL